MFKNRTAQLIFQTVYCTLGFVGCVASLGIFDNINLIRWDFYVHFTNISNYFCIGVMLTALIQTAKRKEDGFVTAAPMLKFIGMLAILLTFLVFNIMLAGAEGRDPRPTGVSAASWPMWCFPSCTLPTGSSSMSAEIPSGITPSYPWPSPLPTSCSC